MFSSISGKISFPLIIAFVIIAFELSSLHYGYTGYVQTLNGPSVVRSDSYGYPQFSDEWVEASLAAHSIASHSLPLSNPLADSLASHASFPNILIVFDSLLAILFFLFGLSPFSGFAILAIAFGVAVCAVIYIAARSSGAGRLASIIALLSIPYIANGANLPGIWFLLPYIASAIPFFLMLACIGKRRYGLAAFNAFIALILYPPMALFILPSLVGASFSEHSYFKKHARSLVCSASFLFALSFLLFNILKLQAPSLFFAIQRGIFHPALDAGIPSYPLWNVVPFLLIPFIIAGLVVLWKKKIFSILVPSLVGLACWVFYAFYPNVIIIEYPRIVEMTALLLMISAACGFDAFFNVEGLPFNINKSRIAVVATSTVLVLFAIAALFYPFGQSWQTFVLRGHDASGAPTALAPSQPLNRYLVPDDLRIWQGISDARFIAPPWKGLVIGAATGNYPLESKASFITVNILSYSDFIGADCAAKSSLAKKYRVSYVYSDPFSCPGFEVMATSSEGLRLYRYVDRASVQ